MKYLAACLTALLLLLTAVGSPAGGGPRVPPRPFWTDGCSLWPDGAWGQCCVEHDRSYWMGGTRAERLRADQRLRECVAETGHPVMGMVMYYGTRIGGVPWLPTWFRWGFGWKYPAPGPPGTSY